MGLWAKTHPKEYAAYQREWYAKHKHQIRCRKARFRKLFPEKHRRYQNARWANIRSNGGSFTAAQFLAICARWGNICLCCKKHKTLTPDHVVPVCLGGSSSISNIQPLCINCNQKKHIKIIDFRKSS
jgi:5-methylcytosine-specific restriction endonuclease McrA